MENDRWLKPWEVKEITGKELQTLANERYRGCGIVYYKVGASIRYKLSDVIRYMEQHRVNLETRG